jgi:hypothetical protein
MYINTWNKQEHAAGSPYFRAGMGGPGATGYDWAIWLFEKARHYFPNSKLVINDFELETNNAGLNEILALVKVLRDRNLIDGFGTQAHHFNVDGINANNLQNALNNMAKSGVPIYVTELDLKGNPVSEANQLNSYKTSFPVYWNHPAVAGITLWGYVEGQTWSTGTGILNSNGTERSAMAWLKSYMAERPDVGYPFNNSTTTGIDQIDKLQLISVYPNPVTNEKITVETKSAKMIHFIEIIDSKGQIVKKVNPTQFKTEIEVIGFRKGMYFLRIHTAEKVLIEKIVVY